MCFQKAAAVHIQIYRLINCKKQSVSSWCLEQEAGTRNIFTTVWENTEPIVRHLKRKTWPAAVLRPVTAELTLTIANQSAAYWDHKGIAMFSDT